MKWVLFALLPTLLCAWGEVRHTESKGIGYRDGYTTLEAFYTPAQYRNWAPFLDLRGHVFNQGRWAANVGIGLRYIDCATWGGNLYYDFRHSNLHDYHQVGCGVEYLSKGWDFRANGYFPVGKTKSRGYDPKFRAFHGHELLITDVRERALTGGNAEVGYHIRRGQWFDLYAAAGPYGFASQRKGTFGGEARLVAQALEYVTLQVNASYDQIYKGIVQGVLGFRLPFGETPCTNKQRIQKVDRQEIIVLDHRREKAVAVNPDTNLPYRFIFVDNTSHSDGTFVSPYPTLTLASSHSSPNDVIYVFPGDGTSTGMDTGITLLLGQRLLGSGVKHTLPTQFGRMNIPAFSSTLPLLTHTAATVVTLNSHNTVSGFSFKDFDTAISGTDITNTQIDKNLMEGGSFGINLTDVGGSTYIYTNAITDSDNGIVLTNNNSLIGTGSIVGNILTNNSTYGIQMFIGAGEYEAMIVSNRLTEGGQYGINLKGGATNPRFIAEVTENVLIDQSIAAVFIDTGRQTQMSMHMVNNNIHIPTGQYGFKINAKGDTQVQIQVEENTVSGGTNAGILASSVDNSQLGGNILKNTFTSGGVRLFSDNLGTLALTLRRNNCLDQAGIGIDMECKASSQFTATVNGNRILGTGTGMSFSANTNSTPPGPEGFSSLMITDNALLSSGLGFEFLTDFNYGVDLKFLGNKVPQGAVANIAGMSQVQALISVNSGSFFNWTDNSAGANDVLFAQNQFLEPVQFTSTLGHLNLNVQNNGFSSLQVGQVSPGTVCLTLKDNLSQQYTLSSEGDFTVDLGTNVGPITYVPNQSAFNFGSCN